MHCESIVVISFATASATVCDYAHESTHVFVYLTQRIFLVGALGFKEIHQLPSSWRHCDSQRPKPWGTALTWGVYCQASHKSVHVCVCTYTGWFSHQQTLIRLRSIEDSVIKLSIAWKDEFKHSNVQDLNLQWACNFINVPFYFYLVYSIENRSRPCRTGYKRPKMQCFCTFVASFLLVIRKSAVNLHVLRE